MTTATQFEIFVMPGEGIGPETITEATELLRRAIQVGRVSARVTELEVGEPAFARTGSYFPEDVRAKIDRACDSPRAAILFGACANEPIGDLRKRADLFANLRPIRAVPVLAGISPLRDCVVADVDMVIVRELVSSIYYGQAREGATAGERWAGQEMYYRASEVRRIVRFAFELAAQRRGLLTWVHKRNVIKGVFALWADAIDEQRANFPSVTIEDLHIDNMAMQMMLRPRHFDVVVTENLFGDILSEIGAGVVGSLGLVPSASFNHAGFALYEPAGGTAPDLAGRQVANPIAALLAVALLCEHTFRLPALARAIENAIQRVLIEYRTADIAESGTHTVSTRELGQCIGETFETYAAESF